MRSVWMTIPLALLVGCEPPEDAHLFFAGLPYPTPLPETREKLSLEFVREWGDRDEGLVFGEIMGLAVSESGTLAVLDLHACRVWLLDTEATSYRAVGGCGDGPGELRAVTSATFSGDTLLLVDQGRGDMVKMTLDGDEIGRSALDVHGLGAMGISDVHLWQDGGISAALLLFPNSEGAEHRQVVSFDRFGGAPTSRGLFVPPIAQRTPRPIVRPGSLCGASSEESGEVIVAVNTWGPQVAVLQRRSLDPILSGRIPFEWARSQEHSQRPGHWGPTWPEPRAACSDEYAIIGYRRQQYLATGVWDVLAGGMVVINLNERTMTVLGGEEPPEPGSVTLMTPGAAIGDRFYFFTNNHFAYPVVREYRLVQDWE